jgi:Spy/CpxP family protein refolding chaperone
MKKLLVLLATAVMALSVIAPVMAQQPGPRQGDERAATPQRREMIEQIRQRVLNQLGLTQAQRTRIAALDKKLEEDLAKLAQTQADRQARAPRMRELRQQHQRDVQAVLTAQQRTRFQELMREEMRRMREELGKGGGKGKGKGGT